MTYYKVETDDWVDDNIFKTLRDAKNHVWSNFTDKEKMKYFNNYENAVISKLNSEGDILTQTPFVCDEKGTHYGRSFKI